MNPDYAIASPAPRRSEESTPQRSRSLVRIGLAVRGGEEPVRPETEFAPEIEALDVLAGRLLLRAGARIGVAHTVAELLSVHRLRYENTRLERDAYDDRALQLGAWRGSALVSTMRLVLPVPGRRLPTEDAFELVVDPDGEVVDLGRMLSGPAFEGDPAHRVWGGLFALAWQEARARGYTVLAGVTTAAEAERYRSLGLAFEVLGPARTYCGAQRQPVRVDPATGERPGWS
jgi:hypothetical protein